MTNTYFAHALRLGRHAVLALALGLTALALAGCETASVFGGQSASTEATAPSRPKIALAPVVGAPAQVSNALASSMAGAVEKQSMPVAKAPGEPSDYTLRGYVVAAPEKAGTKLSYIWDVMDKDGKRAHRITGEETVPGKPAKDPWANVNQQVLDGIASKTALQLAALLPPQGQPATGAQVAAAGSSTQSTQQVASAATNAKAGQQATGAGTLAQSASVNTAGSGSLVSGQVKQAGQADTVAALPTGRAFAVVPAVTGAPGDGKVSLASALQRQLASSGINMADQPGPAAYTVQGTVQMGQPVNGRQSIQIEWQVLDPTGKKLGKVLQNNAVPQGSLDGPWGKIAQEAAAAAAPGIVKLLPNSTRVN